MTLTEEATLHGVLIESQSLATLIARSVIPGFSGNSFEFLSPTDLTIQASSVEGNVWEQDSLTLNVVGKTTLVGAYDREALLKDLAGRDKKALDTVLSGYKGIEKINVSFWPIWRQTFPEDPAEITLEEILPQN